MPHLVIQYSQNIEKDVSIAAVVDEMYQQMLACGIFPLAGIRVRAHPIARYAIADLDPKNAFADLILRIGQGRSDEQKKKAGELIMVAAKSAFAPLLEGEHFALSLEIQEIDAALSWKTNTMHSRLSAT